MSTISIFDFEGNQVAYRKFGHGPSILLAFHGFGQTSKVYLPTEQQLSGQFTVFAIDLFFHGDSKYVDNQLLTKNYWNRLFEAFLDNQKIQRFSLMGFSLGGRFALTMVEELSHRIEQLILIAPDGITRSNWYWVATSTAPGRSAFRYVLAHLPMLTTFGHTLTRLGLLNRTAMRFAELSLGTSARRELVYKSWTQFRLIQPDLNLVSKELNDKAIRVRFFTGAYDRIVPGSYILPLTKKLQHFELTVLETGHNHLIELATEKL